MELLTCQEIQNNFVKKLKVKCIKVYTINLFFGALERQAMTRQLCVYIKRARGDTQKSIHGQTIEKRANILNTQKKYIPASAKKRKFCRYL